MELTEEALLRAIRETPDDLFPRQALGDWMFERPDPREQALGELIQIQCRMASLPEWSPERLELGIRERDLVNQYRYDWSQMFFPGAGPPSGLLGRDGVRRGQFSLREGTLPFDQFSPDWRGCRWTESASLGWLGPQRMLGSPLTASIREMTLRGSSDPREPADCASWIGDAKDRCAYLDTLSYPPSMMPGWDNALAASGLPAQLRRLTCYSPEEAALFETAWPHLEELTLWRCQPTHALLALSQSHQLPALRSLTLGEMEDTLTILNLAPWSKGLTSLRLCGARPTPLMLHCLEDGNLESLTMEGLHLPEPTSDYLATWRRLPQLHTLVIHECGAPGSVETLLRNTRTDRLRSLALTHTTLRPFADLLPDAPLLATVEDLALTVESMSAVVARLFARSPESTRIVRLRLPRTGIDGKAAAALLDLPSLRMLSLRETRLGPANISEFLARPELSKLVSLDLSNTGLRSEGIARLAACPHLSGLRELDLSSAGLTDDSAVSLANSEHLTGLRRSRMSGQFSKHSTAQALAKSPMLGNLVELNLTGCRFGERSRELLRERFGDALVM